MKDKKSEKALRDLSESIRQCIDAIHVFNQTNKCCLCEMLNAKANFAKLNGSKEQYDKSMSRVMAL